MAEPAHDLLPHQAPDHAGARLLLFAMRRMAASGLGDAHAAHALLVGFGMGFRRPLILVRAFMAEAARVSSVRLVVAPCCCTRMTAAEQSLLQAIGTAIDEPNRAHVNLCGLLHVRNCLGLLTSAQAVAAGFADQGLAVLHADA